MKPGDDYEDFSALDAVEHLSNALQYFFANDCHKYKFFLAKQHYEHTLRTSEYTDSKRLFKIVMGTDLVTNKLVSLYETNQGYRYVFKKDYFQQIQHMVHNNKRTQLRANTPATNTSNLSSNKRLPFIEAMNNLTNTSDEESKTNETDMESPPLLPTQETLAMPTPNPMKTDDTSTPFAPHDLTQQAEDLERNMESAIKTLNDSQTDIPTVDILTPIVISIFKTELNSILDTLRIQNSIIQEQIKHCRQQSDELDQPIKDNQRRNTQLIEQYEHMESKLNYMHRKSDECTKL